MDFDNPIVKLKESEKRNKYVDLAREVNQRWNLKVAVIPIIAGAHGTKNFEIREREEIIEQQHY